MCLHVCECIGVVWRRCICECGGEQSLKLQPTIITHTVHMRWQVHTLISPQLHREETSA